MATEARINGSEDKKRAARIYLEKTGRHGIYQLSH